MKGRMVVFGGVLLALSMPAMSSASNWELYDDFNSETIDQEKWVNTNTISTISIENGQLKIIHPEGTSTQSAYLKFIHNPETIIGMKASIKVSSCSGDVRARMAAYAGAIDDNHYWTAIQIRPSVNRITTSSTLQGPPPNYETIADTHSAEFPNPINLIGNTYTASIMFSDDKISYAVEGLGAINFKYPIPVDSSTENWRVLGTRATNGDGPCTVYFDNVYVLRK
ncbi:hypothetical protein [Desulfopila aestuarii]|uniref:Uncharacterized protein n=1 Tax=Desulfopila aestuarii DSM 18488 TaxID=1121416 RepID=A0A1M7YMC1_9BACT|nr:hypothetical protein [Desulfopila aestuarii]SHO53801.1 hypothetical protein SAMN02745220_05322 [Desulfopila aestuarii DSM 18488]